MGGLIKDIGLQLKKARHKKGLSQEALALKVGIPQSHISKIESGHVNLQLSSLIELSRVLDLELMLVPLVLIRSVEALQRDMDKKSIEPRPMYQLEDYDEE